MAGEELWLEKYAMVVVAISVGFTGVLFLALSEWKHWRRRALKEAEHMTLTELPAFEPPSRPLADQVIVVRTAESNGERHSVLPPLRLIPGQASQGPSVVVDATVRFQTHVGIGGSFTESAANLLQQMGPGNQRKIMDAYFSTNGGIGYRVGRVHINSCDFSRGNWVCCEKPNDMELQGFSLRRYEEAILPMMKRALDTAGETIKILASPWSPPAWMKDVGRMQFGGKLRKECRDVWARYYVRFAREMEAAGLPLWAVTVQNEPMAATAWENCLYTAEEERDFVRDHLGPALHESGLDVKLLVWDHNRDDMFVRARTIYADPEAARYVWGTGFHWYGDPRYEAWPDRTGMLCYGNVSRVHELRPDKHLVMTEACQEGGPHLGEWKLGERYAESIIRDLNNWTEAWIDWNLILDESGGPNHTGNLCSSPVIVSPQRDLVFFQSSFFYIGHFSRYIKPGAQRVLVGTSRDALEATAFANPDGSLAVVVLNQSDIGIEFGLEHAGRSARASAPAHSITTFVLLCEEQSSTSTEKGLH